MAKARNGTAVDAHVDELKAMCGLTAVKCRKALEANGADPEKALAALIEADEVSVDDLNPDTVSDELFGRAEERRKKACRVPRRLPDFMKRMSKEARDELLGALYGAVTDVKELKASGAAAKMRIQVKRGEEALKRNPVVLHLPPFPKLKLTLSEWVGRDVLKTWAGFGKRGASKGRIEINIDRPQGDVGVSTAVPPAPQMIAAYTHLKTHEVDVTAAVLEAVSTHINSTLIGKHRWKFTPVKDVKLLKEMMEIDSVHPMWVAKMGMSYIGMFFQCAWDEEHGAGVLIHGSRVIKVGDHDAAHDESAARRDGGKPIRR